MFAIGDSKWPGITKLVEECGEVAQVCGKLMGVRGAQTHFDGTDMKTRLEDELGDVLAAVDFVIDRCKLDAFRIDHRRGVKKWRFEAWHESTHPDDRWHGYTRLHLDGSYCEAESPRVCGAIHPLAPEKK